MCGIGLYLFVCASVCALCVCMSVCLSDFARAQGCSVGLRTGGVDGLVILDGGFSTVCCPLLD